MLTVLIDRVTAEGVALVADDDEDLRVEVAPPKDSRAVPKSNGALRADARRELVGLAALTAPSFLILGALYARRADALDRGKQEGVFRDDVDPVDVHLLISSFCFFRVSNRFTFGTLFGRDLSDPRLCARHKRMLTEAVLNAVTGRQKKGSRVAASAAA